MSGRLTRSTPCVATALAFGLTVPALAQDAPADAAAALPPPPPPADSSQPIQAFDDITEVIVTARRVEERLQDVPISITAFSQEQLTERNVATGSDLATYTPSLQSNTRYGSANASFAIRGFSQESRTTASVGMYFGDVVAPRAGSPLTGGDGAGPGSFFDLANVQVLKGPQGTLFGRNTTGGAILLVPQKPTSLYEGYVESTVGDYDLQRTQAVINVPLGDDVRVRAGIDRNQRDGYLKNISGVGPKTFNDIGYTAARLSVVADLSPSVENYSIASYSLSEYNGNLPKIIDCNRSSTSPYAQMACAQLDRDADKGYFSVENDIPDAVTQTEQWQLINTTTWTATDNLTIKNIVSYAELKNDLYADLYATNLQTGPEYALLGPQYVGVPVAVNWSVPPEGGHTIDQSTMTEELQFQGLAFDERLTWQAGAYFEKSEGLSPNGSNSPSNISCSDVYSLNCYDVVGQFLTAATGQLYQIGNVGYQVGTIDFRNYGLYTQSTFALTDQIKATAGVRYTSDRTESDIEYGRWLFGADGRTPTLYCSNTYSGYAVVPGDSAPLPSTVSDCSVSERKKTDAPTWLVGLDYKPSDDVLLYAKYARGYRQGGIAPYSAVDATVYDAEQVDTYEIGTKTSFYAPIRGTFNVALFYNDFQDQQLGIGFLSSTNQIAGNLGVVNAGKSTIQGVEVEATLLPARGVNVQLSYAYLDTEVKKIEQISPTALYDVIVPQLSEGDRLTYAPNNKLSTTIAYTLPLDPALGDMTISGTYSYQSKMLVSTNSPYGQIDDYGLFNLNLNWMSINGGPVDAGFFVTNVADKKYFQTVTASLNTFGWEGAYLGEPRMFGGRIRVNFGS